MTDEQFEQLMRMLERIAVALEAQNEPVKVKISNSAGYRGSLFGSRFITSDDVAGYDMARHVDERRIDHD
jgi:hypothetical protein